MHTGPRKATLTEWAEHWGRFAFFQLSRAAADITDWCERTADFRQCCSPRSRRRGPRPASLWAIQSKAWQLSRHNALEAADAVAQALPRMFTAVGIFDQFERSLELFEAVAAAPLRTYMRAEPNLSHTHGSRSARKAEHRRLLDQARNDTRVRAALATETHIYRAALNTFHDQWTVHVGEW